MNNSTVETGQARFRLVGVRLDPNFPSPDFYTVLRDEPADWPILYEGQIIFFHKPEEAQEALDFYLHHLGLPPGTVPTEPDVILDFAQALYLLSTESRDEACCVLNVVNTLLDMLQAAAVKLPAKYRADLHRIADHLTFNKEFGSFLQDRQPGRAEVIEALQWALGGVMTRAMFFPKPNS
jgi:hypothetical protein